MIKFVVPVLMLSILSNPAWVDWIRVGENNRLVAYADTAIRHSGEKATYWVLFDYKDVQESTRSGKRYQSEKAQREIDCKSERDRVIFFTWHVEHMGNGSVVHTGNRPTNWEPTSSPQSLGNSFWKFVCGKK